MSKRRVVITGLGWVTSLGTDVNQVWQSLLTGKSGIHPITRFDVTEYTTKFGGEVTDWQGGHIDPREAKRMDRFSQFALSSSIDAVNDSGLDFGKEDPWRCGSIIGSGIGGIEEFEQGHIKLYTKGPSRVSPFMVPKLMCNAASGNVSIHYGLKGPNSATVTACASAANAIGEATQAIRHGIADIMIAGGSEAALTPMGLASFVALKALSRNNDDPEGASRPFDADRNGFILSEGAGMLALEEYEHAKARGARIYAEVVGYGQSADGSHITAPDAEGRGAARAIEAALADAQLNTTDVDYVNAHGTSTQLGDAAETKAMKRALGDHIRKIPVSSTKSMTGHLLGASGGVEAVICAKTLESGKIAPTINYQTPDPDCDLDYVPNEARDHKTTTVISNSFGFGGHNVVLALRAV